MADNIGFPKLEVVLSTMPFEGFSYFLAHTHLKVYLMVLLLLWIVRLFYSVSLVIFLTLQGLLLSMALKLKEHQGRSCSQGNHEVLV
jgi:hypothetical protein